MERTAIAGMIAVALLIGSAVFVYNKGVTSGEESTQKKWDAEKKLYDTAIAGLKDHYGMLEAANRTKTEELTHDLAEAQRNHDVAIANAQSDFDKRLLKSQARADYYKRMSEGGSIEYRNIASHAAELDRSLEEGRLVVRELRETLGLRDKQLIALGDKLQADRKLLTTTDNADGRQNSASNQ